MGKEKAIGVELSGADLHDSQLACPMINLLNSNEVERFVADKAYDSDEIRFNLEQVGIYAEIPNKSNRIIKHRFDKTVYKWRHRIENLFSRVKENRRLALRVDKLDITFIGFIMLALIKFELC